MRAADHVVLRYVYDFLALCAASVTFYYKAGFAFDGPRPSRTVLFSMIACYFCLVAMPGRAETQPIFFYCLALLLFADLPAVIRNLKKKVKIGDRGAGRAGARRQSKKNKKNKEDESSL